MKSSGSAEPLPDGLVEALARPETYPLDPGAQQGVSALQTHISHVYLSRDRVYKLHKAVELPFLSFATRHQRNADCLKELSLNRRLAPSVYIGVAPIEAVDGGFVVGTPTESLSAPTFTGEVPEHCVVMRRLPEGRDALSLLEAGRLSAHHVAAVAAKLANFHGDSALGVPAPFTPGDWRDRIEAPVRETFRVARESGCPAMDQGRIRKLESTAVARFAEAEARFEARRREGRAVDAHGDVHLDHIWFETCEAAPLLIDCIAFNEEFRRIDTAAEVAFLAMDLAYRDRWDLAESFLAVYARETDDYGLYGVIDFYMSHRAMVRASVAALASRDRDISSAQRTAAASSAERHLRLAERFLAQPRQGALVVVCGSVGSGKSSAAKVVARSLEGAVISSDWTRKRLVGLAPTQRPGGHERDRLYSDEGRDSVYEALLARADSVVDSGRVAVLDGTFSRRAWRDRARHWAVDRGVPVLLVEIQCDEAVVLSRVARREREGSSASDAGIARVRSSRQSFEEPAEWPPDAHLVVRTDQPAWRTRLGRDVAARLRRPSDVRSEVLQSQ